MALGGALGLAWSPVTPGTPRHFAWQAWHKLTSTVVLRARRGTTSHPLSFCVAGVALMALGGALGLAWSPVTPVTPRHFAWQAWHKLTSMSCTLLYVPPTYRATLSHTYTYIHSYLHTYVRMYIQTYIRTYVHAYYLFTYFHTQSFTTSFVFPSFSDPATTFETHYWKKLTCGVIRSFNSMFTPPETAKRQVARVARLPGPTRLFRRAGVRPSRFPPVCYCIISGWWFQPL